MKICLKSADAVSELHKRGFTDDFQLLGNVLLWVQGKVLIKSGEFAILECHTVCGTKKRRKGFNVYGIVAPFHNSKGILISHTTRDKQAGTLPELQHFGAES
jgi:hypothetical protein